MHKLVKEYLDDVLKEEREEREIFLINEGLYDDVYAKEEEASDEFPLCDSDGKYYRREAIKVTDEEYKLILKAKQRSSIKKSGIALSLNVIGVFYAVIFFIVSIVAASTADEGSGFIFVIYMIIGFITCAFIFAYAKIINLLQELVNQNKR